MVFLSQMASRKRKSTTSRPQPNYDTRRFTLEEAWNRYADNALDRNILPERNMKLYIMEFDEFRRELESTGQGKFTLNLGELEFCLGEKFCFKNITNNTYAKIKYDELLQYQMNFNF